MDGVTQIQVNPIKEITFANGLRSILRQDPDVILIGEIRDLETAKIAFQLSLTGHLVFSTLYTKNAISAVTRLFDLGLEPYLVTSSLVLVVAQRLLRRVCPHCLEDYTPSPELLKMFQVYIANLGIKKFIRGKGCNKCDFKGYFGRTAIFEFFKISENVQDAISNRLPEDQIFMAAKQDGFITLAEVGIKKVSEGVTTLEEVARVTEVSEIDERLQKIKTPGLDVKILIADDCEDILDMLEMRLKRSGYKAIRARNGEELVRKAISEKPDLIITDITMPVMSGFEATKILKKKLETASIPILMLTARRDTDSELEGIEIGADDYVIKPFDHTKLLARVKMLLRRKDSSTLCNK